MKKLLNLRDGRCSSSDSLRISNKSRVDSFNIDFIISGVSLCEFGLYICFLLDFMFFSLIVSISFIDILEII